jgi:levanase
MSKRLVAGIAAAALGLGTLGAGAVVAPAILAGSAQASTDAPITVNSTTSPVPDAVALGGSWTRSVQGGYTAVVPSGQNAAAVSEQLINGTGRYTAEVSVDPGTPYGVGALLFRAAADASSGYAATIDPNLDRVRLFDLATGEDVVPPAALPLDTGRNYSVDVHLDGPRIYIAVDGVERLDAMDQRYESGHLGLHAYNGEVHFGQPSARSIEANLTGWTASGAGWQASATGFLGVAAAGASLRAIAADQSPQVTDFTTDVQITSAHAVGAVLFRSNNTGSAGYAAEVDPNAGRLRLYRIEDNATLGVFTTSIAVNQVYRLRVTADGGRLAVHWQTNFLDPDGYAPVITAQDAAHGSGHVGVLAYNGESVFQSLTLKGLESSLEGWRTASGGWEPDARGVRGAAAGAEAARFIPAVASDVVASLDLDVAGPAVRRGSPSDSGRGPTGMPPRRPCFAMTPAPEH